MLRTLGTFLFKGYDGSSRFTDPSTMGPGSSNYVITGNGKNTVFKGLTAISGVSARVQMLAGDDYVGLGSGGDSTVIGSVFKVLGALFYIGAGSVIRNGVDTTLDASTTLKLVKVTAGALSTEYQAGMAAPSAPVIAAVSPTGGLSGKNNGVVSVKIFRIRSATGGRSNASPTSNIIQATNQSIAITFPSADANGQDYWGICVTKNGEGALGNHFILDEVSEATIAGSVTATATLDSDTTIGVPNGTLSATHIGWTYSSAGDTATYITNVGAADSHSAGKQTITLNAASVITGSQSATFARAVSGTARTYTFEWRDSDLAGADLAPIRDYPPPAGLFGGSIGDVAFVDGCLGDSVSVVREAFEGGTTANTTISTPGNAIAISDPARPESFPPDTYIFTGDSPTALLAGAGVYWRCGRNSVGIIRYVGGSPAANYERIWAGIGVQKQHNIVLGAGGRLYAFTGQRGLVRLGAGGEPDTAFAVPIAADTESWTASNVVLGYDSNHSCVLVMHERTILCFYEGISAWGPPITVFPNATGNAIKSAVTVNGSVYIGSLLSSTMTGYLFNVDDGVNYTAIARTQEILSEGVSDLVSRLHVALRADNTTSPVSISTYRNGSSTAHTTIPYTPEATGKQHLPVLRPNARDCKSWSIGVSITSQGGDAGVDALKVEGVTSGVTF